MKKIVLLIITLFLTAQTIKAQTVVLDANGVTVKWTGSIEVPPPYFVQASPSGTLEWFAIVNNSSKSSITNYAKNIQSGITYFTRPGTTTPIPFNNIVTTLVTDMSSMFYQADSFNQPISSWDVSNVTTMSSMFSNAPSFNQPIGSWNVSNVTNMFGMFAYASACNQNISSWNVSNVTNMISMFQGAVSFNQNISSWNVNNVTNMNSMFKNADAFNQNISSWNVNNVTNMSGMFFYATSFNQPIGSWNVSNVTNMSGMFTGAQLSTANYDALLLGWSTISPNETPLKLNVVFSGGNSKYCNGASARNILDFTPNNWTITDGGLDCSSLDIEEFVSSSIKLYPNPVVSILNVKADYNQVNQPYAIVDDLGRVVLNGKINEVECTINVEQLSKGVYFIKVNDNNSIKFIKM